MFDPRRFLDRNAAVVAFGAKMLAVFAVWFVVYELWLLPDGRLDAWLSVSVARMTEAVLVPFFDTAWSDGRDVWIAEGVGVRIENGCNGLSALSLFVGFVIAYPGTWARRALFIPAGLLAIVATNVLRCASLLVITHYRPDLFEAVHGTHALFVFYVVIFALWVLWTRMSGDERQVQAVLA